MKTSVATNDVQIQLNSDDDGDEGDADDDDDDDDYKRCFRSVFTHAIHPSTQVVVYTTYTFLFLCRPSTMVSDIRLPSITNIMLFEVSFTGM